jgi:hypothetical protein
MESKLFTFPSKKYRLENQIVVQVPYHNVSQNNISFHTKMLVGVG